MTVRNVTLNAAIQRLASGLAMTASPSVSLFENQRHRSSVYDRLTDPIRQIEFVARGTTGYWGQQAIKAASAELIGSLRDAGALARLSKMPDGSPIPENWWFNSKLSAYLTARLNHYLCHERFADVVKDDLSLSEVMRIAKDRLDGPVFDTLMGRSIPPKVQLTLRTKILPSPSKKHWRDGTRFAHTQTERERLASHCDGEFISLPPVWGEETAR